MSNYLISNKKSWNDIILDGIGGEGSGKINSSFSSFINVNQIGNGSRGGGELAIIYHDIDNNEIRLAYGINSKYEYKVIKKLNTVINNLIGHVDNNLNYCIYYTDSNYLYYISTQLKEIIDTKIYLNKMNNNDIKVSLRMYCENLETLFMLSIGSNIYTLIDDANISYNLVAENYDGRYFYPYINNGVMYVAYTMNRGIIIMNLNLSYRTQVIGNMNYNQEPTKLSAIFDNTLEYSPTKCVYISNQQNLPITISFWFNVLEPDDLFIDQPIISMLDGEMKNAGLVFQAYNGGLKVIIKIFDETLTISSGDNLYAYNKWNHCCLTINKDGVTNLYANNKLIGCVKIKHKLVNFSNFMIGGANNLLTGFKGYLHDFIVYNREIGINEINDLYHNEFAGGNSEGRIIYLKLTYDDINDCYNNLRNRNEIIGYLPDSLNLYTNQKLVYNDNTLYLFVINTVHNSIYCINKNSENSNLSLSSRITNCEQYIPYINNNEIHLLIEIGSKVSDVIVNQSILRYQNVIDNKDYLIENYVVNVVNGFKYITYIDSNSKLHSLWKASNSYKIETSYLINEIKVNKLYPEFVDNIYDYVVKLEEDERNRELEININGRDIIIETFDLGQIIKITDNIKTFYIRIISNYIPIGKKVEGSGFYSSIGSGNYYIIHDQNGVPLWYFKNELNNVLINRITNAQKGLLFLARDDAKINAFNYYYPKTIINIKTLERFDFNLFNDLNNSFVSYNLDNSIKIGYTLFIMSKSGYIQEQNSIHNIIWEIDLNLKGLELANFDVCGKSGRVNREIIVSFKNYDFILGIDYNSQKIVWCFDPTNSFLPLFKETKDIIFLQPIHFPNDDYTSYVPINNIKYICYENDLNTFSVYGEQAEYNRLKGDTFEINIQDGTILWKKESFINNWDEIFKERNPFSKYLNWLRVDPCFVEYYSSVEDSEYNDSEDVVVEKTEMDPKCLEILHKTSSFV